MVLRLSLRPAFHLRRQLTQEETKASESIAQFVVVDVYVEAGGEMRSDLFASEDEHYLKDTPLLMQLALAKLTTEAEKIKREGGKWVDAVVDFSYSERSRFGKLLPTDADPTAEEQMQIDALESQISQLQVRSDELEAVEN